MRTARGWANRILVAFGALLVLAASLATSISTAPPAAAAPFVAHGSVNQVYTYGHPVGSTVDLLDSADTVVASGVADAQGAKLFREVPTGTGYKVVEGATTVAGLTVTGRTDHPAPSFYQSISLNQGFTYIPTRDGTLLSATITFPTDGSPGPWPVMVEYSGYDPSQPPGPPAEAQFFPPMGYVVVGVNMRGTTCSGGAFDYFEYLQSLDGYDVIEAVAAQPWSTGSVGMAGISYSGISQLFVAQTRPPHLSAITPLSVISDFYRGILYPGGIRNVGFPYEWAAQRDADAQPAAHGWVQSRIANGDTTCAANQVMHLQYNDLTDQITDSRPYELRGDYLAPRTFVDQIDVPTFLSGATTDEQTGGHWPTMAGLFAPGTPVKVQITNGTHIESLGPEHANRVLEFAEFYVAKRKPVVPLLVRIGATLAYNNLLGISGASLEPDRFTGYGSYGAALAAYEAEPPVRVYWENGAGRNPGEPFSTVRNDYASWPPPTAVATAYYLDADGRLASAAPTLADAEPRGVTGYDYDPASKSPKRTFAGSTEDIWHTNPGITWGALAEGKALSFVTDPFTVPTAFAGSGSADLWMRSTEADTDLEVTITEVRPDGQERFVQSGWLRASHRAIDAGRSTDLVPFHSYLAADQQPLVPGEWTLARVELFPFAYVFRAGSRLRVNVEAPGGNQPFWQVDAMTFGHSVTNEVAHSAGRPSRVVLPKVPDPGVPATMPPCPSLRNQPCRTYAPGRIPSGVRADLVAGAVVVSWKPPPGATPTGYRVTELSTNQTFDVDGDTTTSTFPGADDPALRFRVQAIFGTEAAPVSDASLAVGAAPPEETTTTTSTSTSTTAAPGATTSVPGEAAADGDDGGAAGDAAAAPTATAVTGNLPLTGAGAGLAGIGVLLVLVGGAVAALSRRRGASPRPGAP